MKEEKEIDIDDEEQILKECDFDYFYNSENCSRELCCFFNDITMQRSNFNKKSAIIDLGRIAITLNQQDKRIKELENKLDILRQKDIIIRQNCRQGYVKDLEEMNNLREENQQLKQQLAKKEEIIKEMEQEINDRDKHIDSLEEKNELLKKVWTWKEVELSD